MTLAVRLLLNGITFWILVLRAYQKASKITVWNNWKVIKNYYNNFSNGSHHYWLGCLSWLQWKPFLFSIVEVHILLVLLCVQNLPWLYQPRSCLSFLAFDSNHHKVRQIAKCGKCGSILGRGRMCLNQVKWRYVITLLIHVIFERR